MTTAFVLGGGGVLGAVEVGMLRALFERDIRPTSSSALRVGALNGAMVARDPSLAVIDRLDRAVAGGRRAREVYGDRPLRTVRRAVATGTHIYSPKPLRQRLAEEFGDLRFEDLPVRVPGAARPASSAPPSTGSTPARWSRRSSPAPPYRACCRPPRRRRALPRRRHRQLDPARPGRPARRRRGLRAPGRPDRPAAHGAPQGRGRWPGCRSRSPGGTGSPASWPSCPTAWCPRAARRGARRPRDDSLLGYRDFAGVAARIDATYRRQPRLPRRAP